MSGPLDSLRQFYDQSVRPFQDRVADIAEDVARTAGDVAGAASDVRDATGTAAGDVRDAVAEEGVAQVGVALFSQHAQDVGDGARILILDALNQRSPKDFVEWLTGPAGPSLADYTAAVPGLQDALGDVIHASMENPMIAGAVGKVFGFEYVPGLDFYTTTEHSMQSYLGFHDAYDKVGKLLGMDLDDRVVEVEVGGIEYKLELWKGSYGAGGAYGGEIGLYTRGADNRGVLGNLLERIPGYYTSANDAYQIKMTQSIYNVHGDPDKPYFTNEAKGAEGTDGKHFWNLAIRTDPGVNHEDLGQRGTLEFPTAEVAKAICAEMNNQPGVHATLSNGDKTITYTWE